MKEFQFILIVFTTDLNFNPNIFRNIANCVSKRSWFRLATEFNLSFFNSNFMETAGIYRRSKWNISQIVNCLQLLMRKQRLFQFDIEFVESQHFGWNAMCVNAGDDFWVDIFWNSRIVWDFWNLLISSYPILNFGFAVGYYRFKADEASGFIHFLCLKNRSKLFIFILNLDEKVLWKPPILLSAPRDFYYNRFSFLA
jgi:hypothetical protein